ncbi:MAG: hypothetical protein DLM61_02420, partial [Pseudonocardiales bacterium]
PEAWFFAGVYWLYLWRGSSAGERARLAALADKAQGERDRLAALVDQAETQLLASDEVRTEFEDLAATAALAEARAESVREESPDREQLDELEQKLAESLAARSAAEARADRASAERDRLEAELAEEGAGRPAIESAPQAPVEVEAQVTVLTTERDRAVADAARLEEARDEAIEQAEAEASTREELEARLAEAAARDDPAGSRRETSAAASALRMRSEYVVGWTLLLIALVAAIAVLTGAVRVDFVP